MNRGWDFDYDDIRSRLNKLEGVVTEVNKVCCNSSFSVFLRPKNLSRDIHQPQGDLHLCSL